MSLKVQIKPILLKLFFQVIVLWTYLLPINPIKMNDPSGTEYSNLDTPPHPPHVVTDVLSHKWAPVRVSEASSEKRKEIAHLKLNWKSDCHLSDFGYFFSAFYLSELWSQCRKSLSATLTCKLSFWMPYKKAKQRRDPNGKELSASCLSLFLTLILCWGVRSSNMVSPSMLC